MYSTISESDLTITQGTRPKVRRFSASPFEKVLTTLSILAQLAMWIILFLALSKLPLQIPMNTNSDSALNTTVSKLTLLLVPAIGLLGCVIFEILTCFPQIFLSTRIKFTIYNTRRLHIAAKCYIRSLNLFLQAVLLVASVIWSQRALYGLPPGILTFVLPTIGFLAGLVVCTCLFNSSLQGSNDEEDEGRQ